ncbi:TrbL/VirB6 plasmid conjugal transfer protein [uncultured archaeon]|nr:TrbL/VirB6 plasmid conjugal transfer protein [uncultured archaeon]
MFSCPKCGTLNDNDTLFCTKCGASLKSDTSPLEQPAKSFAQDMNQMGKNLGESVTHAAQRIQTETQDMGKRIEQRVDHASKYMENWYNRNFGIFGPLLESFIFLIVLRLAIIVLEIPSVRTLDTDKIAATLLVYILPLFAVTLLSNYTKYFARKSYKFRVFSPLFYAISLILLLWIITKILYDVSVRFAISDIRTAAVSLENSLPTIFIFALLIGYVILFLNMPRDHERTP